MSYSFLMCENILPFSSHNGLSGSLQLYPAVSPERPRGEGVRRLYQTYCLIKVRYLWENDRISINGEKDGIRLLSGNNLYSIRVCPANLLQWFCHSSAMGIADDKRNAC